jgi:MFS family permease
MFAFRKPFTAASFEEATLWGVNYKVWLVIAQTLGYTLSKFYGISFIAELKLQKRSGLIIGFIVMAWLALLLFAVIPAPYNIICFVINGFPLGMIYGLVFSYLEGRKSTEFLGATLATSFIFAAGFTQSIGKWLLQKGIDQWWMPFLTGAIFMLPTLLFVYLLDRTPLPTAEDKAHRTERKPMNKEERKAFVQRFLPGLILLILAYIFLTVLRDYRSNFAANIWTELGRANDASVFTRTEIPASIVILIMMSALVFIRKNIMALLINHVIVFLGFALSLVSTIFFMQGLLDPFWWMAITGIGLYMGYVPFNSILFDRLIASFQHVSNAGFLIYLADSFGYIGSDAVLIVKSFFSFNISWTRYFSILMILLSILGMALIAISWWYFSRKYRQSFTTKMH